jgi:hypothetical protein
VGAVRGANGVCLATAILAPRIHISNLEAPAVLLVGFFFIQDPSAWRGWRAWHPVKQVPFPGAVGASILGVSVTGAPRTYKVR